MNDEVSFFYMTGKDDILGVTRKCCAFEGHFKMGPQFREMADLCEFNIFVQNNRIFLFAFYFN